MISKLIILTLFNLCISESTDVNGVFKEKDVNKCFLKKSNEIRVSLLLMENDLNAKTN
jgi:hypothetical protein